jgi:hypothetical protein
LEINSFGDHDPLPIPADMEADAISTTFQLLTGQRPPDKHIDPNASYKKI